jgi:predicted enzyme related to lactoylglutathione lyase
MNRPVHFEIHAEDPDRASAFYTALFGWTIQKWDGPMPYWLIDTGTGTGINGGIVQRMGAAPAVGSAVNGYVVTMDVESCDAMIKQIKALGGMLALDKMPIPGMGWLAYGIDTEGNIFGVMQSDPAAK